MDEGKDEAMARALDEAMDETCGEATRLSWSEAMGENLP